MSPRLQSTLAAAGLMSALLLCATVPGAAQGVDDPPLRLEESEDPFPQPETPPTTAEDSKKTTPAAAPDVTVTTTDAPPPPPPPPEPTFADPTGTTDAPPPMVNTPSEPPAVPEIAAPVEKPPEKTKKEETVKETPPPADPPVEKKKEKKKEIRKADPKPAGEKRIARLLSEGRGFLKTKNLTTPKGASAADRFRAVLALEPANTAARAGLNEIAGTYSGWGERALDSDPRKALGYLQNALDLAPDNAAIYRLKGQAHRNLGQWRQALDAHRKAQSIRPDPRADEFAIGHVLAAGLKRFREALPHLQKAEQYMSDSAELYNDLADAYHNLGMQPKAVAAVKIRNRLERQAPKKKDSRGNKGGGEDSLAQAHAAFARGDYDTAQRGYFAATAKGNTEASYRLGRMYHQGLGFRRDLAKAMIHYKHAAIGGHPGGKAGLGYMYYRGLGGLRRNYAKAFENFLAAAKAGISGAQYRVGYMYEKAQGVARNSRNASYWYITAAKKGNRAARKRLIELKMKPSDSMFAAPAEINTGPGELPPLSEPTVGATVEGPPERKPPPPKPRKSCGGLIGGLGGC